MNESRTVMTYTAVSSHVIPADISLVLRSYDGENATTYYTHLVVYAQSALAEQTTPRGTIVTDIARNVTNVSLVDIDLDAHDLGGYIQWQANGSSSRIESYYVYLAGNDAGIERSQVSHEVLLGTNQLFIPADTHTFRYTEVPMIFGPTEEVLSNESNASNLTEMVMRVEENITSNHTTFNTTSFTTFTTTTTTVMEYTHLVIYTKSSLAEQTTPTAYSYLDTMVNVSNLTFVDFDLDIQELGGNITWDWT